MKKPSLSLKKTSPKSPISPAPTVAPSAPAAPLSAALGEVVDLTAGDRADDLFDGAADGFAADAAEADLEAAFGEQLFEDLSTVTNKVQTLRQQAHAAKKSSALGADDEGFFDLEDMMQGGELDADWHVELQQKNPTLAAQLLEISAKNHLDVDEVGEYINIYYYSDYKRIMRPQTDRSLAEIASIYNCLGMAAPLTLGELFSRRPEENDSLYRQISKLVDELPRPEEFQQQNLAQLLVAFARNYSSALFDDEFMDTLTAYAKRALKNDESTDDLLVALRVVAASRDPRCLATFMDYHHELMKSSDHGAKASIVQHYYQLHGLTSTKVQGFRDNVFPMLAAHDSEVKILENPHGAWAVNYGEFSLADFACHALVSTVEPRTTAELLWAYRTILASDFQRFEAVRYDAAQLQDILFPDYGFIYDSRPGAHELLQTMVDYYDASEQGVALEATTALQKILAARLTSRGAKYYDGFDEYIFDLGNYDRPVHLTDKNGAQYRAPAIEVLRRLTKNTHQSATLKPHTGDIELDSLIEAVEIWTDPDDHETKADWEQTGELIKSLNGILLEKQGNIGLRPSCVATINFAENLATHALASLTAQDRIEMPFDDTFKEILKFRELIIAPGKFNSADFEKFWQKFSSVDIEDVFSMRSSFQLLRQHTLRQLNQLAAIYLKNPHTAHLVPEIWQDGLVREICRLARSK